MRIRVRAGPVAVYTGVGARDLRVYGGLYGSAALFVLVVGLPILLVIYAARYWYISLPVLVAAAGGGYLILKQVRRRQAQQAVELRQARAAEVERLERARDLWLSGPPPPIRWPSRFTRKWLEENAPLLHPEQLHALTRELLARGWSETRIEEVIIPIVRDTPVVWTETGMKLE